MTSQALRRVMRFRLMYSSLQYGEWRSR